MLNKILKKIYWKTQSGRWDASEVKTDLWIIGIVFVGAGCIYLIKS